MAITAKTIALSVLAIFGIRTEEQPHYAVIDRVADVEIRRYSPRLAAEVTVSGGDDNATRSEAFQILAGYIFGKNNAKQDIAMTAPVATQRGEHIAMTAPVQTTSANASTMTMRFFLPAHITLTNAPGPLDSRVKLVEVPEEKIAALRFSGSWSTSAMVGKQMDLLRALRGSAWLTEGEAYSLYYDPPFTLPFLRRNEAAVRVRSAKH